MARRWVCPECQTGRLAPSRMAADDTRRYCLDCSAKRPKLVEMVCPSLEVARAKARERQRKAARNKRERETRERYYLTDGADTREIGKRVRKLRVWAQEGRPARTAVQQVTIDVTPVTREYDADVFAMELIWLSARKACRAMGVLDTQVNTGALIREASTEYWGLDGAELLALKRLTARLTRQPISTRDTVLQALRARRNENVADQIG